MRKTLLATLLILTILWGACQREPVLIGMEEGLRATIARWAPNSNADFFRLPESSDLANIPQSPVNPLTPEKIALGKMLFYETAFSSEAKHEQGMFTFSCSSCHVPAAGFRPNRQQGIADGALGFGLSGEGRYKFSLYDDQEIDAQGARPLSVLNVAFVTNTMWNGSFGSDQVNAGTEALWGVYDPGTAVNARHLGALEGQNIEGLKTHRINYDKNSCDRNGYTPLFDAAFPDVPVEQRYSRETASFAISAYLRQLLCNEAPFQRWLKGEENAMTLEMKRGALLFFGKAGCVRCHNEPNLGSVRFEALGVEDLFENGGLKTDINDRRNLGRGGFTGDEADMFRFRVPQLYNMADSGPYFHGSSKKTLGELLVYFNNGIPENPRVPSEQVSKLFHPLHLTNEELKDLESFLKDALHDPNLQRYVPERVMSGNCFPNNDPVSQNDMQCH